jgi:predicted nucleic acid-binding protein
MLVLDNSLLSDYLTGRDTARSFLDGWSDEPWAISSIVQFDAYAGALYGHQDLGIESVESAISPTIDVLDVTGRTAREAARLQAKLIDRGVPGEHTDVMIAATASENAATFATADQFFWKNDVQDVLSVAEYHRDP